MASHINAPAPISRSPKPARRADATVAVMRGVVVRHELKVFADVSLKKFDEVLPAAGAANAAIRISPEHLARLVGAQWVDVAQGQA
ncbi:hypothetical protein ACU4GD_05175 [Cupriavidus basilensis]